MKKYVVGVLLVSIVMFVQVFNRIPVFADAFVPTSYYDIIGLSDLGYSLVGGAEFDFSGTPYVIDDYNSLSQAQKDQAASIKAREFLKDYCESRGIAFEEDGELHKGSYYYTTGFGLAGLEMFEAFQLASDPSTLEYNMPISPSRFADWAQYNKWWFKTYANQFGDTNDVVVNPDPNYVQALNFINDSIISVANYDYTASINNHTYSYYNPVGSFFCAQGNSHDFVSTLSGTEVLIDVVFTYVLDVNLISNNDTYSYTIPSSPYYINNWWFNAQGWYVRQGSWIKDTNDYITGKGLAAGYGTPSIGYTSGYSFSGTLSQCFDDLTRKWKNVNIYVDGDPWSLVSNPAPANPVVPTFPDILNQNGRYDNLAYDIPMPNTNTYEGTFDITSVFDAIREGIIGASDGDLATGSTIGSLDVTRGYEGEGIDINERVVDLTSTRVFDGTLTDNTTGKLPDPGVYPDGISAGLGGVTILAKYVDATQCILPEDVVTAFWGIVWILLMLGLIKNLHR